MKVGARLLVAVTALAALGALSACRKKEEAPKAPPTAALPAAATDLAGRGAAIFREKCTVCHKVSGSGGTIGTDLSAVGTRHDAVFLQTLLQNPAQYYPQGVKMPPFREMSKEDMDALITYLLTLKEEKK